MVGRGCWCHHVRCLGNRSSRYGKVVMDEKSIDLGSNLLTMTDERDTTGDELFTGVEDIDDDRELAPILTPEDRPRGILSPTDREYLCGHKEYAQPQTDANRRQAIRERVVNGLEDFALLSVLLEPGSGRRSSRSSGRRKPTRPLRRWSLLRISGLRGSSSVRDVSRARHPPGGDCRPILPISWSGDRRGRVHLGRVRPQYRGAVSAFRG